MIALRPRSPRKRGARSASNSGRSASTGARAKRSCPSRRTRDRELAALHVDARATTKKSEAHHRSTRSCRPRVNEGGKEAHSPGRATTRDAQLEAVLLYHAHPLLFAKMMHGCPTYCGGLRRDRGATPQ
jgi:hypothetical protein